MTWPALSLPLTPPLPPMEAKRAARLPSGSLQYEPKWDGFRCLAFKEGDRVALQSKAGLPLDRYFPEVVRGVQSIKARQCVFDGELVVPDGHGGLSFDALLQRIHPAASRVDRLSRETPALYLVFDLLLDDKGRLLTNEPLSERRRRLERFAARGWPARVQLSPATLEAELAGHWLDPAKGALVDGVMAKRLDAPYRSGERDAMTKVKRLRSADCVVGGYRRGVHGGVGSLLLGLYDDEGLLHHVGFSSSFNDTQRQTLLSVLTPYEGGSGFTGRAPGGPSRWSGARETEWIALIPDLVCEVQFDHFSQGRFRHGTRFLRWRPDKAPGQCTFEQVEPVAADELGQTLGMESAETTTAR